MDSVNQTYYKSKKLIVLALIALLTIPNLIYSQIHSDKRIVLTETAKKNYIMGLQSDNIGVKKNYIYFAGKYRITDVSHNLLEMIGKSDNDELCKMLVWSLYQIGDDTCFHELWILAKNHQSKKLRDFCSFLHKLKNYETALVMN